MPSTDPLRTPLPRDFFDRPVLEVAPDLLGRTLVCAFPEGTVELRLTEVEAYDGPNDPGSHAYRGRTTRNAVMFGEPGHVYVYFTYGMHFCMNLVCGPPGTASGVLLRAGEITAGVELARKRRPAARKDTELAQGPARMTLALGVDRAHDGADACPADPADSPFRMLTGSPPLPGLVLSGPRTGVSGAGADTPWRYWIEGDPTVSPYRPHSPRRRTAR
ncbi:DNA-3-methyladenine glycosylase [Peterkaempfera bronchialis]|uniref:Putative 3-methyladenine DNA glycosylase n=1 Tax=Peterkaempfera bronchialis TaxID=2126346 RepID=A0A345T268_9ACTN|nr:DNA-3-methyladenine glycosylase [Peterkaempfera bronchialis]AXI80073.1 DNA-3-methyladenine glycosylase [Peterkaempfera bronchialis]